MIKFSQLVCLSCLTALTFSMHAAPAFAQNNIKPPSVSSEDWQKSGQDAIVALRLDGRVINILHEQGNRYLRQGYDGRRDDKRNVEANPSDMASLPSRTTGFDWVLQSTGDGYYNIINMTTGLYLTLDSDDERNVSNWGQKEESGLAKSMEAGDSQSVEDAHKFISDLTGASKQAVKGLFRGMNLTLTDHQKWRFVLSDTQKNLGNPGVFEPGTYGSFRIYNKRNNQPLTMYDFGLNGDEENVTVWPDPGAQAKGFDWAVVPARDTAAEGKILKGNYTRGGQPKQFRSTSLASVRRLTIEEVRAIKVSTGQDDATKVLFAGIDLAIDTGIGIASGGASTAATTSLKYGGRALSREALQAAAKAAAKDMAANASLKKIAKEQIIGYAADMAKEKATEKAKAFTMEQMRRRAPGVAALTDQATAAQEDATAEFAKLSLNILDALSSEAIFNSVYGESPDDFYIKVNGSSIFPSGGREHMDISSQQTVTVNKSFVFDRFDGAAIQLMEYDYGSNDDSLGEVRWVPHYNEKKGVWVEFDHVSAMLNGKGYLNNAEREALPNIEAANKIVVDGVERYKDVLISKDSEGSLYEITYCVEPFVPAHMVLGKLHSKRLAERIKIWSYQEAQLFEAEQRRLAWVADRDDKAAAAVRAKEEAARAEAEARAKADKEFSDRIDVENTAYASGRAAFAQNSNQKCSARGRYKSEERTGEEAAAFGIFNHGSKPIQVYWINTDGDEVDWGSQDSPIQTIEPGISGAREIGTSGYWYIAVDDAGECVGIGSPVEGGGELNFNPDLVVAGVNPRKAAAAPQTGYNDDGSGYADTNEYADDQSGLEEDYAGEYGASPNAEEEDYSSSSQDPYVDSADAGAEGPGCEYLGQVSSPEGGDIVKATFNNATDTPLFVFWIDEQGEANNYERTGDPVATIPAHSYQGVRTKIGHVFAAADQNGICYGAAQIESGGEELIFNPLQ